jgi:hypothetical protein
VRRLDKRKVDDGPSRAVMPIARLRLRCARLTPEEFNQMRRLAGIVLTLMTLATLSACSGSPTSGPTPTASPRASTTPSPSATPGQVVRGIYRFKSDNWRAMADAGFNHVTDGNSNQTAQQKAGLVGILWMGGWDKAKCSFEATAGEMAAIAEANKGHGYHYQLGDEPNVSECPNAAREYRRATELIHQHDPTGKTWVAIDQFNDPNMAHWPGPGIWLQGAVDILAFDVYPCQPGSPCRYDMIDGAVRRIHAAGVEDWQFILQDFQNEEFRWPTPDEVREQFRHWQGHGASGYWVFAWDYQRGNVTRRSGNLDALRWINSQSL